LAIIVWDDIPDLSSMADAEEMRTLVEKTYPGKSAYVIGNWAGQLWRFRAEIAVGDLVVLPRLGHRLAIGRVTSDYEWRPDGEPPEAHVRTVQWLRTDIERSEVEPDLRDSLGSLLTVYELRRNNAAERIEALAAGRPDPGSPHTDPNAAMFGSTEELLAAAAARESDDPIVLPVRNLLKLWGAQRRGSAVVDQIQRDLAATGLTTEPPFTSGDINGSVAIVPLDVDPDTAEPEAIAEETAAPPVSYLVGNLASATSQIAFARAGDPLADAVALMYRHNFSQLPVLFADGTLQGALTWKSIVTATAEGTPLKVVDALTHAPTAYGTDSLLSKVGEITDYGFVLVLDDGKRVTGIVTSADLANQFADRVQPFILVEEVEQRLRGIVDSALADGRLALEWLQNAFGRRRGEIQAARNLTLGQYHRVFESPERWEKFGLAVNHDLFLTWVFEVKDFRNNLMHFSPDPLAPGDLVTVQGFLNLLKALDPTP
jgi:restriction system protein